MQPNSQVHLPPKKDAIERRSISMYEFDWSILEAVSREKGLNISAVNRMIVREWAQSKIDAAESPSRR